jgi:excisionase family DNA binding protein
VVPDAYGVGQCLLLTVSEAARQLGIGRSLFYELLADGQVESIHVGRLRRIPIDALATYIDRQRCTTRESVDRAARAASKTGRRAS